MKTIKDISLDISTARRFQYEMRNFIGTKNKKINVIVLDVETNGLMPRNSVLSCSAFKIELDPVNYKLNEIDSFERYYFPKSGRIDPDAAKVNKLSLEIIKTLRGGCSYPELFIEDNDFKIFCQDVLRYVSHNIGFDLRYIKNFIPEKGIKTFCTMKSNKDIIKIGLNDSDYNDYKLPNLRETAEFYNFDFDENLTHRSKYDAEITENIFNAMFSCFYKTICEELK